MSALKSAWAAGIGLLTAGGGADASEAQYAAEVPQTKWTSSMWAVLPYPNARDRRCGAQSRHEWMAVSMDEALRLRPTSSLPA
jgi:hypothetical protein